MFCDFLHSFYIRITQFHPRCLIFLCFFKCYQFIFYLLLVLYIPFLFCCWYIKIQLLYIDLVSRGVGKLNSNDLPIDSTRSFYIQITLPMSSKFYFFPIHMIFVSLALMCGQPCCILDLNGKEVKISVGNIIFAVGFL